MDETDSNKKSAKSANKVLSKNIMIQHEKKQKTFFVWIWQVWWLQIVQLFKLSAHIGALNTHWLLVPLPDSPSKTSQTFQMPCTKCSPFFCFTPKKSKAWQFFTTIKRLRDLQLRNQKATLNHMESRKFFGSTIIRASRISSDYFRGERHGKCVLCDSKYDNSYHLKK